MVTIEFTPAEVVHIMADCPSTPMVGPRLDAWLRLNAQAEILLAQARESRLG